MTVNLSLRVYKNTQSKFGLLSQDYNDTQSGFKLCLGETVRYSLTNNFVCIFQGGQDKTVFKGLRGQAVTARRSLIPKKTENFNLAGKL